MELQPHRTQGQRSSKPSAGHSPCHVRIHAESLGFTMILEELQLTPSQTFTYLGMLFNSRTMQVSPKMKCLEALETLLMDPRAQTAASAR